MCHWSFNESTSSETAFFFFKKVIYNLKWNNWIVGYQKVEVKKNVGCVTGRYGGGGGRWERVGTI